ncbi:MAG: tripartite tricarboxylate transporter substrate binding protein [Xanthobacteraceae bacterium]|nr:tripartite tricarboxylate transporter substrate binding protein [Xanthobacteraceae bacterium]
MKLARRRLLQIAAAVPLVALGSQRAPAQAYPARPVRIIVTTGPGGQGDTTARLVAAKLSDNLGQSFYVENMPGGGGNIAMAATARATPDGYTILAATSNIVTNISLYPKINYDPYKDFDPISLMCSSPHVLVVHPSVPANSINELVALAKASPGKYSFASAGRGTPAHLAGELFKLTFGVDITHVPFNGGGPATASTLGGHVPISVSAVPTAVIYVRGGQLRALGMFSSTRSSALPDVPTMKDATGHDLPADIVNGFIAPAGTPRPVIEFLHRETVKVLSMPDTRGKLATMGFDPVGSTPAEFAAWIRTEIERWGKIIRDANIALQ